MLLADARLFEILDQADAGSSAPSSVYLKKRSQFPRDSGGFANDGRADISRPRNPIGHERLGREKCSWDKQTQSHHKRRPGRKISWFFKARDEEGRVHESHESTR